MSFKFGHSAQALLPLATAMLAASPCFAAGWESNVKYNGTLKMDLYTPSKLASPPPVVVAIHFCTGNSGSTHSWFQSSADKYGFYIISPDAGKQCFDASPTRDGDKAAVVKMVDYVVTEKGADKSRVFVAGASSGGCMTNTLIAIYPDVFAGGAAAPGFPAGGWPAGDISCTKCGSQPPTKSAKEWGDIARNAFSWTGARPKSQQWVGENDEYNFDGYLPAVVSQFTDLMGLDGGASATGPSGWVRKEYKDSSGTVMLQTNIGTGMAHDLTSKVPWSDVVSFFGLDKASSGGGGSGSGGASSSGGGAGGGRGPVAAAGRGNTGGSVSGGGRGNVPGGAPGAGGAAVSAGGKANPPSNGGAPSAGGAATGGVKPTDTTIVPPKGAGGASTSKPSVTPATTGGSESASGGSNAANQGKGGSTVSTTSISDNKSNGGSASASGGSSSSTTKNGTSQPETNGNQTTPPDSSGGCSIASNHQSLAGLFGLILTGVALLARRRQRVVD